MLRLWIALLALLLWLAVAVSALRGSGWQEALFWAVIGSLCLAGVEAVRRRSRDAPAPDRHTRVDPDEWI